MLPRSLAACPLHLISPCLLPAPQCSHRAHSPHVLLPPSYVLIEALPPEAQHVATLVRGYSKQDYPSHADVFEQAANGLASAGYTAIRAIGGGHLRHLPSQKSLMISGDSLLFGSADQRITQMVLRKHFGSSYLIDITAAGALRDPDAETESEVTDRAEQANATAA